MAGASELAGDGAGHQLGVPRIVVADALVKGPEENCVNQPEGDDRRLVLADDGPGRRRHALIGALGLATTAEPRPIVATLP